MSNEAAAPHLPTPPLLDLLSVAPVVDARRSLGVPRSLAGEGNNRRTTTYSEDEIMVKDELSERRRQRTIRTVQDGHRTDEEIIDRPAILVYKGDLARLQIYAHEHNLGDSATALRHMLDRAETLTRVTRWLDSQEDTLGFALSRKESGEWITALEWGSEAEDSPMAGAASYGLGDTAWEAIKTVVDEVLR